MGVNSCEYLGNGWEYGEGLGGILIRGQYHFGAYTLVGREAYHIWEGEERIESCTEDGACEDWS